MPKLFYAFLYFLPLRYPQKSIELIHNIEKNESINDAPKPNIITELNLVISEIKNKNKISRDQIATDLKILIHLIGDLNKPLHDGYG